MSLLVLSSLLSAETPSTPDRPNLIVIFCDDLGYGDLGCYGSEKNRTPHIDRMAKQGMRFTDFYSSSPVCTPSRASLLTACYPRRINLHEAETQHWVLIPRNKRGLHPEETTMAELLKAKGYATACIGKWHLGDQPEHLPTEHGFDEYFGIPYSNDMQASGRGDPPLPLVRGKKVIEAPVDQSKLTQLYTQETIRFIEEQKDGPFFVYLPHTFPHVPIFASPDFKGKSANGIYGDSVEEIDWSTGEILKALERLGLDDRTLVIFTSDNGSNGRKGGSNAPLSGNKGSTMEGGMRVPMVARWPGVIPAGSECEALTTTMDLLPTFAQLAGAPLPDKPIDGHNILPLLKTAEDESPYEAFYYYRRRQLQAVRMGEWKWHLPLEQTYPRWDNAEKAGEGRPGKLVHLEKDPQETTDLSDEHPEVIEKMKKLVAKAEAELGNEGRGGAAQRPALDLAQSKPMLLQEEP